MTRRRRPVLRLPPLAIPAPMPEVAMGRFVGLLATGLATTLAACTRAPSSAGTAAQPNVIRRADIERVHASTALDAVQRYRADLLTARAPNSVYLNRQTHP